MPGSPSESHKQDGRRDCKCNKEKNWLRRYLRTGQFLTISGLVENQLYCII